MDYMHIRGEGRSGNNNQNSGTTSTQKCREPTAVILKLAFCFPKTFKADNSKYACPQNIFPTHPLPTNPHPRPTHLRTHHLWETHACTRGGT